eukprot:Seg2653.2 transcript_id=Seg2653.2/GoldUCD/mRNA.D3Y31 product="Epidermal growth factor receptor substrate 15-like 1" protein_id=Seg2653.2/GoldUCD/D3Y31
MPSFPPLSQISSHHYNIYEAYYKQANPSGTATIGATEAASILKRSGLNEATLHKIWEFADTTSAGYLDKQGFFVALKLVALAQSSKELSSANLTMACPPPKLGESPRPIAPPPADAGQWIIKQAEKQQYDGIFETLHPVNGYVSGEKVKPVLLKSKLPVDVLGRVWDMSDIDQDGKLDRDEFAVAMHLVYRALDGEPVPTVLTPSLIPPSKRHGVTSSAAVAPSLSTGNYSPRSSSAPTVLPPAAQKPWVVTPTEKAKYDTMFLQADTNKDGLVSGPEVRNIFIASGLPQQVLAHIWSLCDTKNVGLLNAEQFALAMYLITQKRLGVDPPQQLTPEMYPPTMREKDDVTSLSSNLAALQAKDFAAIKELDQINQEIEKLGREKITLQQEIEQTEETIRKRKTEIEDLQSELSKTENATKDLQVQKNDAQEKLNNVEKEKAKYEEMLTEVRQTCEDEKQTIATLRTQISSQESTLKNQEEDFAAARKELNELRDEESTLEQQVQNGKTQLEQIKKSLLTTKNEINQMRTKIAKLTEENQTLNASINQYTAMSNSINSNSASSTPVPIGEGLGALPENLEATFAHSDVDQISARATAGSSPVSSISGFSVGSGSGRVDDANDEDFKDNDPFKPKSDVFGGNESETPDPFHAEDPFKQDPFKTVSFADDPFAGDPFHDKDPFHSSDHDKNQEDEDPFKSDPFKPVATSVTPSSAASTQVSRPTESAADPFSSLDPFGSGAFSAPKPSQPTSADPFSSDPFAPVSNDKSSPTTTKKSSTSSSHSKADDPFFGGGSGQSSWPDPFASNHSDPFASSNAASIGKAEDPWSAFADDSSKNVNKEKEEDSKKIEMDVALALKQSVESSSEA